MKKQTNNTKNKNKEKIMKANEFKIESVLKWFKRTSWSIVWEGIMSASEKDLDFPRIESLVKWLKTYEGWAIHGEEFYLRRTKQTDENGNTYTKREWILKSNPVTAALDSGNVIPAGMFGEEEDLYAQMIDGALGSDDSSYEAIELKVDLELLGIPEYFIEKLMIGEKIIASHLTPEEVGYLKLCRKVYANRI